MFDVVIIGGGPAGMSAALSSGRGKMKVLLIDEEKPRNAVTRESHGFLTRDGITPDKFREVGRSDLQKYPTITIQNDRVQSINQLGEHSFKLVTLTGKTVHTKNIILATGLKETLPDVKNIEQFYGNSIFSCPFCDGWEMKDRSLVLIMENTQAFHLVKLLKNWTDDLVLATNGQYWLDDQQKEILELNNISIIEEKISSLNGDDGELRSLTFEGGKELERTSGFCATHLDNTLPFINELGIEIGESGYITTNMMGQTNIPGIYAAGDIKGPSQLMVSASQGHMVGMGIIANSSEAQFITK